MAGEWTHPLRPWQEQNYQRWLKHSRPDYLMVATPGAGKTIAALRLAHHTIRSGRASRLVVISPTESVKRQWAREADASGLAIDPGWTADCPDPSNDFLGIASTYHAVSLNPDRFRALCRRPTFVILDEIHHAGVELRWGDSLTHAFGGAVGRLLLSGTPFRSDNTPIPFVVYEDDTSRADFNYGYAEALSDEFCRPVFFPSWEGRMKWYSHGRQHHHDFADKINEQETAKRLKTALDPSNDWLRQIVRDADAKLTEVRTSHHDAGGLVVCIDRRHANQIARIVEAATGEAPTVVLSDNPEANDLIDEFNLSTRRWIVAVKMVSEGVDIKRLRVGIYATNVSTEIFFRQVVGRFVRVIQGIEDFQNAYLYIPAEPTLIGFAESLMAERNHQLEEEIERLRRERSSDDPESDDPPPDDWISAPFVAISAEGRPDDIVLGAAGDRVTQDELAIAERYRVEAGITTRVDAAELARFLRVAMGHVKVTAHVEVRKDAPATMMDEPRYVKRNDRRKTVHRLVGHLAAISDREHRDIFTGLMRLDGMSQQDATIAQLDRRIVTLEGWIKEARHD